MQKNTWTVVVIVLIVAAIAGVVIWMHTKNNGAVGTLPYLPKTSTSTPADVPAEYQPLYSSLQTDINNLITTQLSGWNGSSYPVTYSVELSGADSLGGDFVLTNQTDIADELKRDKDMGVGAVEIDIGFPVLDQKFWEFQGEKPAAAAATVTTWTNFYETVAQQIRSLGMKIIIETSPVFTTSGHQPDPSAYYHSLDFATYEQRRAANDVAVAEDVQPDYMMLQNEPATESLEVRNPAIQQVINDPTQDVAMIQYFVNALSQANIPGLHHSILIGSGVGAWQNNWQEYVSGLVGIAGLDRIDIHVYHIEPGVNNDPIGELAIASKIIDQAHAAGKGASIAEFWPHKSVLYQLPGENNQDPINDIRGRDDFSFWAPLDAQFINFMVAFANYKHVDLLSAFGVERLSSYVDYNTAPCQLAYPVNGVDETTCSNTIQNLDKSQAKQIYTLPYPQDLSPSGQAYHDAIANLPTY